MSARLAGILPSEVFQPCLTQVCIQVWKPNKHEGIGVSNRTCIWRQTSDKHSMQYFESVLIIRGVLVRGVVSRARMMACRVQMINRWTANNELFSYQELGTIIRLFSRTPHSNVSICTSARPLRASISSNARAFHHSVPTTLRHLLACSQRRPGCSCKRRRYKLHPSPSRQPPGTRTR